MLAAPALMVEAGRRLRHQIKNAPATIPATSAATMITPVSPKAATATWIISMLDAGCSTTRRCGDGLACVTFITASLFLVVLAIPDHVMNHHTGCT